MSDLLILFVFVCVFVCVRVCFLIQAKFDASLPLSKFGDLALTRRVSLYPPSDSEATTQTLKTLPRPHSA